LYDGIEPRYDGWVYVIAGASLVLMAFWWRGMLARRQLTLDALERMDTTFTIGSGVVFSAAATLPYDFRPSADTCLMYECFTLLARALVVPSTGRRTAIVTSLSFAPMTVAAIVLPTLKEQEIPPPAFFTGFLVVAVVTVLLAWAGSQIIYGLR